MPSWWIYLVEKNGRIYTGVTTDLANRASQHDAPIAYREEYADRSSATAREQQLKRWSGEKKRALIAGDKNRLKSLSKRRKPPCSSKP